MKEYKFKVTGMRCGMCESHINNTIRNGFKVKKVDSNRYKKETLIIAEDLDTEKVKTSITNLGYDVDNNVEVSEVKKTFFGYKHI